MKASKKFKAGDFVKLKIGSRVMRVLKYNLTPGYSVVVTWNHEGMSRTATFPQDELESLTV